MLDCSSQLIKETNMNKNKLAIVILGFMLLANPLFGQYVIMGVEHLFRYNPYIHLVGGLYLIVVVLLNLRGDKVNIPSKKAPTKSQRYIES